MDLGLGLVFAFLPLPLVVDFRIGFLLFPDFLSALFRSSLLSLASFDSFFCFFVVFLAFLPRLPLFFFLPFDSDFTAVHLPASLFLFRDREADFRLGDLLLPPFFF